jgi:hypothetical protein
MLHYASTSVDDFCLASEKEALQCARPEAMIVRQALPRHSPHSLELWIIKDTTEISI